MVLLNPDVLECIPYFYIGIVLSSILISKVSFIIVLLGLDLIFFSLSLLFVFNAIRLGDPSGQVFALFLLPVAVSETALGLALIAVLYRTNGNLHFYGL